MLTHNNEAQEHKEELTELSKFNDPIFTKTVLSDYISARKNHSFNQLLQDVIDAKADAYNEWSNYLHDEIYRSIKTYLDYDLYLLNAMMLLK